MLFVSVMNLLAEILETDTLVLRVLLGKLRIFRPRVVCFNGKSGYTRAMNQKCDYGLQRGTLAGAVLFLAPSSSGALPMPRAEKLAHYQDLKKRVDDIGARASAGMG